jgi:hypothetical protein
MLDQRQKGQAEEGRKNETPDDGLPVIPLDDAYRKRAAERVKAMTGELPLWYTATPQELAASMERWAEELRDYWEAQRAEGKEVPEIPLEALRREHIYEETL